MAKGAAWMMLFKLGDRVLGTLSTLVLARMLVPADFGLVAMAMAVIAVVDLVNSFSFETMLIQKPTLEREHYDTAWTLGLLLSSACGLIIAALAYPSALFYGEPRVTLVMLALAATWFLGGFANIGIVDFRRNMDFGREFRFLMGSRAVAFVVTLCAAVALRSFWALILGTFVGRSAGVLLSYAMHAYRPRFCLSAARELFSFSRWLLTNNGILVSIVRFPHFLIGRLYGSQSLGLYAIGYEFATLPVTELASPVNRVVLPAYSRLAAKADPTELREVFLDVGSAVLAVALPASAGIAVIAEPMVRVLLGDQWLDAAPIMAVIALSAAVMAAQTHNGLLHIALGKPNLNAAISFVRLSALVPLCFLLARTHGMLGIAYAELASTLVCLLASFPYILRRLQISIARYCSRVYRPILATIVMVAILKVAVLPHSTAFDHPGVQLLVAIPLGAAVYFTSLVLLWFLTGRPAGAERLFWERAAEEIRRRRVQASPR